MLPNIPDYKNIFKFIIIFIIALIICVSIPITTTNQISVSFTEDTLIIVSHDDKSETLYKPSTDIYYVYDCVYFIEENDKYQKPVKKSVSRLVAK